MSRWVGGDHRWDRVTEWWVPTVSLMAIGVLTVVVWVQVPDPGYALLDIALPTACASVAVWQGLRLRQRATVEDTETVVRWFTGGLVVMGCLGLWPVVLRATGQPAVPVGVRLLTEIVAGGLFGLAVGLYSVRARESTQRATEEEVKRELLERQREANDLLNRTLRHQLRNGLTVVRGRGELLAAEGDTDQRQWARTVVDKSDQMAETVDKIADITEAMTGETDLEPVGLSTVVTAQAGAVRRAYPEASVTVESVPDCAVRADDLLERALYNVLENAVEHNDGARPTVVVDATVTGATARVRVADDGDGIPEAARDRVLEANERGLESDGDGLGLFLTASILEQYGGDVTVCESRLGGARVDLSLPLAAVDCPGVTGDDAARAAVGLPDSGRGTLL
ncbi:sensor histidine kinase [Halomicroarcula sp. GCM10025817]|uniref:sensor histidine kinase n=2 Tax=Haloarcula TaxID=2237 RepID=UPI003611D6CF